MADSRITHSRYIESFGEYYEEKWGVVELNGDSYALKFSDKDDNIRVGYEEFSDVPDYHEVELEYTADCLPESDQDVLEQFSNIFENQEIIAELN